MLFNNLYKFSNTIAFQTEKKTISYKEITDFSKKISKIIPERSLVFILCDNNEESLMGYVSFLINRVVPLLLESKLNSKGLKKLILNYKPEYLWLSKENLKDFLDKKIVYSDHGYYLIRINENSPKLNKELALLMSTSGSTGSPKLVRLSYKNLYSNANSISEYLSLSKSEIPITSMPINYSFGLSIINSHLINGSTILLTSKSVVQREFWELFKKHKGTSLSGVPHTFETLLKLRFFRMNLPSLKTLTVAGGKLSKKKIVEYSKFCFEKKINFFVMYGQTEASPRMSYLPPNLLFDKSESIGISIPNGSFFLNDEQGKKVSNSNTVGELVYEGDNVCLGYANDHKDLKKGDQNNNILFTGDLAKRDIDGFYYIVGRKKRFVKLFGKRVNLDEIENHIKNITTNCACIDLNDKVLIYITEKNISTKVIEYISFITNIHFSAFEVKIIDKIPLNSSGKINYSKL
jgi:long-chain acyl-CoA synthetase